MFTVTTITDDAWNWNTPVGSGSLSISMNSTFTSQNQVNGAGGVLLETGPVTSQTFAGGAAPSGASSLYMGGGDYSTLFNAADAATITLTPDGEGAYTMTTVGFGQVTMNGGVPQAGYWQPLGYPGARQDAIIATNFVGLGLPAYLWYQTVNLLYKHDLGFDSNIICDNSVGGICKLQGSCSSFPQLWTGGWSFKIQFQGATDFVLFPIGALAEDDTQNGVCNVYIQYLDDLRHSQSSQVVLGSMYLQMFKNYVSYDLTSFTTTYKFQLSASCTLNTAYIGNVVPTSTESPFTALYGLQEQIFVNHDFFHYKTTIGGQLGFQGNTQFQVSLLGNYAQTFEQHCLRKASGQQYVSCEDAPTYATNYFNQSEYYSFGSTPTYGPAFYGGYNTSGYEYSSGVCIVSNTTKYFCSNSPSHFYVADSVYEDNWNYDSAAASGIIGFGKNSPVWDIVGSPATKEFDVQMSNFNSWTWANANWVATSTQSVMNMGGFSTHYTQSMAHTTFSPYQLNSYLFELDYIGFGKYYDNNKTEFYESVLNFDTDSLVYGIHTNKTSIGLNFRGLGLPEKQFNKFVNLLNVATYGEATCLARKSGYCVLSSPCSHYATTGLWDYTFKMKFNTNLDSNYVRVPLATFAANYDGEGGVCVIFVEYLDPFFDDSKAIQLGSMFFQSIYAQYTLAGVSAVSVSLYVNENALDNVQTYIGAQANGVAPSPFIVPVAELATDSLTETNGLPTFVATTTGVTDTDPYWHLDFSASHTIAWSLDCQTTAFSQFPAGSCADEPVNAILGFDGSPLPPQDKIGSFSQATFGGYVVSGDIYESKLCFGGFNCKWVELYGVNLVQGDNWNFGGDGAYGVLGMGPTSYIWEAFVDPDVKRAYYSISLGRVPLFSEDGATAVPSNITFGGTNNAAYVGNPSVYMTSLPNYTYALNQFAFGIVYQTNGADSSEYFYNMSTNYPVEFVTNFRGLGLPADLYSQFVTLFEYITGYDAVCQNTVDGICTLPAPCANYSALNDYFFKVDFTNDVSGNYIRIPLATFAQNVKSSGGATQCNVDINYLNTNAPQSNSVLLGGLFFQEFFVAFVNDYHDTQNVDQGAQIWVNENSLYGAYVGNEVLPTGVNPFVPHPPEPTPTSSGLGTTWIVVISLIACAVVAFLGYLLYKYKMAQDNRTTAVVGQIQNQVNASGTPNVSEEEGKLLGV